MAEEFRAVKHNISKLTGVATFNDDFRDALKGNHGLKKSKGFVSGLELREEAIKFGIVAATNHPQIVFDYVETSKSAWAAAPDQCVNYVSCHDNYTLWDKLQSSFSRVSDEDLRKMVKLAGALILTSQGIPFLHAGVDFCRTKGGNGNSYKSPDSVNQIDWDRKKQYLDVFHYFKNLIQLRKDHPALRMTSSKSITDNINFCTEYQLGVVSYCIDAKNLGDSFKKVVLAFNGRRESVVVPLPEGKYQLVVSGDKFGDQNTEESYENEVKVDPISMIMLALI
jgi:pullulanase